MLFIHMMHEEFQSRENHEASSHSQLDKATVFADDDGVFSGSMGSLGGINEQISSLHYMLLTDRHRYKDTTIDPQTFVKQTK